LIFLNSLVWAAFGVIVALGKHPSYQELGKWSWVMAVMFFGVTGTLLLLCYFLRKGSRIAYHFVVALLTAATIIIFFNDVGLIDLIVLILTVAPLVLLIKDQKWYLRRT
jgi:presenilin-like A22 family membrane protease